MSSAPAQRILTETFRDGIGSRQVRAAVFTTFNFDPKFFELQVLPALFDRAWARDENVRRAQVEEELARVDHVAVYYDRNVFDGGQAGLDYRRLGVARKTGCFHAKQAHTERGGRKEREVRFALRAGLGGTALSTPALRAEYAGNVGVPSPRAKNARVISGPSRER